MADLNACASCASNQNLKRCRLCKTVVYCSVTCQKAHWQTHKRSCHFRVVSPSESPAKVPTDALSLLRTMPDPGTKQDLPNKSPVAQKVFNIPELRLAVFSLLPPLDLLGSQRVCRSWYLTSALEHKLQQRLFFAAGPGDLVLPAITAGKTHPAIHPYNSRQREALAMEQDMEARHGGTGRYLLSTPGETAKELSATEIQKTGAHIIANPFLLRFWPQHPDNMTLLPVMFASNFPQAHSWRRMQLTSPPITSLSMSLWFTKSNGQGNQILPATSHVPSGVTLGHLADMLAAQPKKLEYQWMQLHGYASWSRSTDATVLPKEGDKEHPEGYRGVYVNPSNGIAFPGGFGTNWR